MTDELLPVTQEDRDLAASIASHNSSWSNGLKSGFCDDDDMLQKIATHRLNTRAPQPANAELVERLQQLADTSTPAPWGHIRGSEDGDEFRCAIVAERKKNAYLVATIENGAPGDVCDTELANAKLIAELRNNLPTIIAALAKLEGKTP